MTKNLFEIWNIIEKTPPRLRVEKLDELCGDDNVLKSDVLGCIEMSQKPDISLGVFSVGFSSFVDSYFEPNKIIGQQISHYTITEYIADGGMAHVFLAERTDGLLVNQTAVVKIIKPHLIELYDYNLIDREANIMAQLKHKYITRVIDAGVIAYDVLMLPCYIMDYMKKGNIVSFFNYPLCHIDTKINAIIKICNALVFSHNSNVEYLHADIKPQNILINEHSDPMLCDFGIAQRAKTSTIENHKKYAEVYSCDYSPPEIANNEPLNFSSDVYSLAVVLYEMLTGLAPPFDIKNNLPSKNIKFAYSDVKYRRWIKELDTILVKATEKNKADRYKSALTFLQDLQSFIELGSVGSHQNNYFYRFYKYLWLKPTHAFLATAGAISAVGFSVLFFSSSSWVKQQNADNAFLISISENYANAYKYGNRDSLHGAVDVLNNNSADKALVFKHAMAIGEMALTINDAQSAKDIYKKAMSVSNADDLSLVTALYAKALLLNNNYDAANKIIKPLFKTLANSSFSTPSDALAYLELFETDVKYISSDYDDKRDDLQLLKEIENSYWDSLSSKYKSLLSYHQATELFYFYDGSNISVSDGVDASDHQQYLKTVLIDAKTHINQALLFKDENIFNKNEQLVKNKNLKSRILYELGEYEESTKLANNNVKYATELLDSESPLVMKTHRNKYLVLRLLDLVAATNGIKDAVAFSKWRRDDTWMLNTYFLGFSYLYIGDINNVEKQVANVFYYTDMYKKNNLNKGFIGLDSAAVLLSNYLQFTGFDRRNPLFDKVVNTLAYLLKETKKIEPDYIKDYELKIADLYLAFSKNKNDEVMLAISEIIEERKQMLGYQADDLARIMLDMALITAQINYQDEFSLELANKAEALFVWSELEKTHSPDKMSTYLQLADIYLEHGKHEQHNNAMREARMVYNTHYEALKDSFYSPMFNQKAQISLVK